MTLRHYEFFVKVCETMNMTAAAAQLYISQSAVSQAIAELESHYGLQLFKRQSNRLYLTQAGEQLWSHASAILEYNLRIEEDMLRIRDEKNSPPIRVGYNLAGYARLMPQLIQGFLQRNTGDSLKVSALMMETAERLLLLEELDLAICEGQPVSSELEVQPLGAVELGFICNRNTCLLRFDSNGQPNMTTAEIQALPFILQADDGAQAESLFREQMAQQGISVEQVQVFISFTEIQKLLATDRGIGITRTKDRALLRGQREVHFAGIQISKTISLLWKRGKALSPAAIRFMDYVRGEDIQ